MEQRTPLKIHCSNRICLNVSCVNAVNYPGPIDCDDMRKQALLSVGVAIATGLRWFDYTPSKRLQFCFLLVYLHCVELLRNDFMRLFRIMMSGYDKHGRPAHTIDPTVLAVLSPTPDLAYSHLKRGTLTL